MLVRWPKREEKSVCPTRQSLFSRHSADNLTKPVKGHAAIRTSSLLSNCPAQPSQFVAAPAASAKVYCDDRIAHGRTCSTPTGPGRIRCSGPAIVNRLWRASRQHKALTITGERFCVAPQTADAVWVVATNRTLDADRRDGLPPLRTGRDHAAERQGAGRRWRARSRPGARAGQRDGDPGSEVFGH